MTLSQTDRAVSTSCWRRRRTTSVSAVALYEEGLTWVRLRLVILKSPNLLHIRNQSECLQARQDRYGMSSTQTPSLEFGAWSLGFVASYRCSRPIPLLRSVISSRSWPLPKSNRIRNMVESLRFELATQEVSSLNPAHTWPSRFRIPKLWRTFAHLERELQIDVWSKSCGHLLARFYCTIRYGMQQRSKVRTQSYDFKFLQARNRSCVVGATSGACCSRRSVTMNAELW